MKTITPGLEQFRRMHPVLGKSADMFGYFVVPTAGGKMAVISSGEAGHGNEWEHVSVSLPNRTPNWNEMQRIKELFWADDETVIQFHPRKSEYVNQHPFCLHLWKHKNGHDLPPQGNV